MRTSEAHLSCAASSLVGGIFLSALDLGVNAGGLLHHDTLSNCKQRRRRTITFEIEQMTRISSNLPELVSNDVVW
jgi:hypothetical protein